MKASLQLKMGQQLTMTPQLQQAIRLLQLSTLDLQQEIQEALDSNPMLELEELEAGGKSENDNEVTIETQLAEEPINGEAASMDSMEQVPESTDPLTSSEETEFSDPQPEEFESSFDSNEVAESFTESTNQEETPFENDFSGETNDNEQYSENLESDWSEENYSDEQAQESTWEDAFQNTAAQSSQSSSSVSEDFDFESRNSEAESLQDNLLWQLNLTPFSDTDHLIAVALIDGVDDNGYLKVELDEILESLDPALEIEMDEVEAVLKRLQQFEPAGIFARDLRECMLLQLLQPQLESPWIQQATMVVENHMELLGNKDYATLMRRTKLREPELKEVMGLIMTLNPRPGAQISPKHAEYIVPDVFVRSVKDAWRVELNPDIAPKLRINEQYASLVKRADQSDENTFLKDNLQEARWFLKSLQSRNETLLKVATKIVEYQQDFLEQGEEAMKPLVLHDIAEAVGMHESTISRVTTQKYMYTPRGIFELKYFFSSHVSTASGGECSSTAIRAMIKKLIAAETPRKPLSDSKIANMLGDQGIQVARRTVAKYREAMAIPPSNERKRLV